MAVRKVKPFAKALKIANSMLLVDMAITLYLVNGFGKTDLLSVSLALLPPAWAGLVLGCMLAWIRPIRPSEPLLFPTYITYPLLSAALVFCIAVLTCGKSPSIVALESEAAALKLWTNYPIVVVSTIAKIVVLTVWSVLASRKRSN